ncbi:MAG TPA: carboxypeptidase-like regulatory domain-containing protein, partial [Pyrinomonadaceae bacterium]|nr:carboxypeptidase-like regulatory domain-containing protein [Pyrinomonadaceae bacterium]
MLTRRVVIALVGSAFCVIAGFSDANPLPGIPAASAQEASATIYGTATDAKGALVPGVKVTAVNESTGIQREATTNSDGVYTIPLLPAGRYTITAEMPGFAILRITNVALQVSINSNVPIVLAPKQIAESVSVEAQNNRIDTSNATVRFSVTNEQVQGLPVLTTTSGRNVLGLLPFLVPGVTPTDVFGTSRSSNLEGLSMSINGARPESNSYNFAGANNNDNETNGSVAPLPNPDALQEFTILTNSYPADQGRGVGGIVNAVAKTGTNKLHGNARYIGINEALNARGFFDLTKPVTRLHTFGGQLGGPVVIPGIYNGKNRTFFFVDYEGTRSHIATTRTFTNVLTQKERAGDFSSLAAAQRPRDP